MMVSLTVIFTTLALLAVIGASRAATDLTFASYYRNHMVLQRGPKRSVVWGYAKTIGDTVTISVTGSDDVTTTVSRRPDDAAGGVWKVKLHARTTHTAVTITATSSDGTATLNDVLFGDVWVCSGQSNMVFNMGQILNSTDEINRALTFHNIRYMKVGLRASSNSLLDLNNTVFGWTRPINNSQLRSFSAVCLLYAMNLYQTLQYPLGLVETAWGGTPVEDWSSGDVFETCKGSLGHGRKRAGHGHGHLWNSMVNPLLNMTIYGAIWYQGEANSRNPQDYSCLFPAMIDDWREKFHQGSNQETSNMFPFGFVQLAANANRTHYTGFPDVRWAQTAEYGYVPNGRMHNVFMSVAMDLPDFHSPRGSIHPRDKEDVADRLALAARAVAYGEKGLTFSGPIPTSFKEDISAHRLTIEFDHGNVPVTVRDTNGFQVCCGHLATSTCSPTVWTDAAIVQHDASTVTLNTGVCHGNAHFVTGVRYAWEESPCPMKHCALYGRDTDLPAPPFVKSGHFVHV